MAYLWNIYINLPRSSVHTIYKLILRDVISDFDIWSLFKSSED